MYIIQRPEIDLYKTIQEDDKANFFRVASINPDNKFQLVTDKEAMKEILLNNFASKKRGGEYKSGLPSATVISSGLFPMCFDESENNSIGLFNWFNNQTVEDYNKQQEENKKSLDAGNFIHKILELSLCHDVRIFERQRNLDLYIEWAGVSEELENNIENFQEKLPALKEMAKSTLSKFFENELKYIDPIFNEIFIRLDDKIQGAIDLVCYYKNELCLLDFKSSKKSKSHSQLIDSGYTRQLQIYSDFLLESGIISKQEYDKLTYKILFVNWNSNRYKIEDFAKEEVQRWKMYNEFILNWFHEVVG